MASITGVGRTPPSSPLQPAPCYDRRRVAGAVVPHTSERHRVVKSVEHPGPYCPGIAPASPATARRDDVRVADHSDSPRPLKRTTPRHVATPPLHHVRQGADPLVSTTVSFVNPECNVRSRGCGDRRRFLYRLGDAFQRI